MPLLDWLGSGWNFVINASLVVVGLGLIIFLHELGHFLMAKKNKVRVEVFSLGFGHAIFKFRRGDTEYRIAWLPLGGYVKMAGETLMDDRKGEPWELTSKTPWQRFQIFVAGAVMNLLIAFPIGTLAYVIGMQEHTNEVGMPGTAEAWGGIRPGDEILEVDGRKIESLDKFRIEMVRRQKGAVVPVTVRREGRTETFKITALRSENHLTDPARLAVAPIKPGSRAAAAGLEEGNEITHVDQQRVTSWSQLDAAMRSKPGKEVALKVRRRTGDFSDPTFDARLKLGEKTWHVIPLEDSIIEPKIGRVVPGRPAAGKLEAGDLIESVNGKKIESWQDLKDAVEPHPNTELDVAVLRQGERKSFKIRTAFNDAGAGGLGIAYQLNDVFAVVKPGSYFDRMGVKSGDKLAGIEGYSGDVSLKGVPKEGDKEGVPERFHVRSDKPRAIKIEVQRKAEKGVVKLELKTEPVVEADLEDAGFKTMMGLMAPNDPRVKRRRALGAAVRAGMYEPVDVTVMTLEILKKLVTGNESAKNLSGPIGIMHASYHFAQLSIGNFIWLLCVITVNLGIFNLLPIPILDGGHNLLLGIEVVRKWMGKPPPTEKFVAAFQYSGLLFILGLFVFVTFNDITRFFR